MPATQLSGREPHVDWGCLTLGTGELRGALSVELHAGFQRLTVKKKHRIAHE